MAQRGGRHRRRTNGLAGGLTPQARAVMRAFREARHSAPGFVLSCGVLPEVSESASDRLHGIVHALAERRLGKRRHMRDLQRSIRRLASRSKAATTTRTGLEAIDQIDTQLTALLALEATAAYLFGLSVGLAIRSLPERLNR
jgi:hypothetical protein